jgi:hypothetical protein
MTIVDDLLANPGLYVGIDRAQETNRVGSARLVVTPLPGNTGVTLDYEIYNATTEPVRGHAEHTVIGRAHGGGLIMVIADIHAGALVTLHETEPGTFEPGPDGSPYAMKVVVAMPEPGVLHHHWWYGSPDEGATPKELADLTLVR